MTIQKIPVNPSLRPEFNVTAYEDRPPEEIEQWWDVPYIVTDTFEDQGDKTFDEYVARMRSYGDDPGRSREEWDADKAKHRENWFVWFPSGIRYEVRCLDGGAWDRPTCWGVFSTLADAERCAQSRTVYFGGHQPEHTEIKPSL